MQLLRRFKSKYDTHPAISGLARFQAFLQLTTNRLAGLYRSFTKTELVILVLLVAVIVGGSTWVSRSALVGAPSQAVAGGVHIEGLVGEMHYLNPLLAGTSQVDQTVTRFIYSGLTKITPAREVVGDLAVDWEIFDDGTSYIFHLRQDAKWHDGVPFNADDVVYTINVLQSEGYAGLQKNAVMGVGVEKIDEFTVKFSLPNASAFFLYDMSMPIIAEHVFGALAVDQLAANYTNAQIIGTGPYALEKIATGESVSLKRFAGYYGAAPYLDRMVFFFFDTEKSLAVALKNRTVSGGGFTELTPTEIGNVLNTQALVYSLPQYKGLFFNQASDNNAIKNQAVRQALAYATNKDVIIEQVERGWAQRVDSPILPGFWGHKADIASYEFNIAKAAEVLKKDGWADVDKDGFLEKDGTRLQFTLTVRNDSKSVATAQLLQSSWGSIGAEVGLQVLDSQALIKDAIRPRAYEILLFGQDLGADSDPYVYWHSSQATDPGLALAVMFDKDIDNNLEAARTTIVLNRTISYYHAFQNTFAQVVPAILLYQPKYLYLVDVKVKGATDQINLGTASDRFANVGEWFIKTKKELE